MITEIGKLSYRALRRARLHSAAEWALLTTAPRRPGPTVLIIGMPRIGKSTVAREVARYLRTPAISSDDIDSEMLPGSPSFRLLERLCENASGLVIEGKALTSLVLTARPSVPAFMVGCCDSPPDAWEASLRRYGGWAARRGDAFLRQFAETAPERSRALREQAEAAGIEYFEIPREDWSGGVRRAVGGIVGRVIAGQHSGE